MNKPGHGFQYGAIAAGLALNFIAAGVGCFDQYKNTVGITFIEKRGDAITA
jgi:hypothetical protein